MSIRYNCWIAVKLSKIYSYCYRINIRNLSSGFFLNVELIFERLICLQPLEFYEQHSEMPWERWIRHYTGPYIKNCSNENHEAICYDKKLGKMFQDRFYNLWVPKLIRMI